MATTRWQQALLLWAFCAAAAPPALAESLGARNLQMPADFAGEPCGFADPGDPQRILGPNPAHADCLVSLYSPLSADSYASDAPAPSKSDLPAPGHPISDSLASTVWLYLAGIGMLVLAGFNSRKRRRHIPLMDLSSTSAPPAQSVGRREGALWSDD